MPSASERGLEELAMQRSGIASAMAREWYSSLEGMAARHYLQHRCSVRELMAALQGYGHHVSYRHCHELGTRIQGREAPLPLSPSACTLDDAYATLVPAASEKGFEELAMQRSGIDSAMAREWYSSLESGTR